jgi:hypothetical protein
MPGLIAGKTVIACRGGAQRHESGLRGRFAKTMECAPNPPQPFWPGSVDPRR